MSLEDSSIPTKPGVAGTMVVTVVVVELVLVTVVEAVGNSVMVLVDVDVEVVEKDSCHSSNEFWNISYLP